MDSVLVAVELNITSRVVDCRMSVAVISLVVLSELVVTDTLAEESDVAAFRSDGLVEDVMDTEFAVELAWTS